MTGFWNPLSRTLVECSLEVLQSSALGQVCQAHVFQGTSLGGFSNDRNVQCIHVPAAKFFSLQRRERLGKILLMETRQVTSSRASVGVGETGWTGRSIDHQNLHRRIAAVALGCSLFGASRTGHRGIHRARSPRLEGWPTDVPPRVSPTAEVSTDRSACTGGRRGGRTTQESTGRGSTVAAGERRGRTR